MHLKAVPHGLSHAAGINPALVPAKAVAVPEAVRHSALSVVSHRLSQGSPGLLSVQIGLDAITRTVPTAQWWEFDQLGLPTLQQVPGGRLSVFINQW
jgi:hypothetical protein